MTIDDRKLFEKCYLEKRFEKEFVDELEKLLGMKVKVPIKVNPWDRTLDFISIDNKIGIELSIFSNKDIMNDPKYEQMMNGMKEYEYRFINNKIINSGTISHPIKLIIEVGINTRKKLWYKINKENRHFFEKKTNKFNCDYSIIILNCKYFMYNDIFSDCQFLLKKYGNGERYRKLIGILIIYPKDIKDVELSFDDNILIRNPHCEYNPFTNLVVYKDQKFINYPMPMSTMCSIPEGTEKIFIKEMTKTAYEEVIRKYIKGRILGYHTIGIKNCILTSVIVNNKEIEIVWNDKNV